LILAADATDLAAASTVPANSRRTASQLAAAGVAEGARTWTNSKRPTTTASMLSMTSSINATKARSRVSATAAARARASSR
jgi:hypothetical protein